MEQLQQDKNWRPLLCPVKHPNPARERPTMFYSIFTLLYVQFGVTRKFRHFVTCPHNVVFHSIENVQKRQLWAAGSICQLCPHCPKILHMHTHANLHGCPGGGACPQIKEISANKLTHIILDHLCLSHQQTVPHPYDLDNYSVLPIPNSTPFQFTFHTTAPQDSVLIMQALISSIGMTDSQSTGIRHLHEQQLQREQNLQHRQNPPRPLSASHPVITPTTQPVNTPVSIVTPITTCSNPRHRPRSLLLRTVPDGRDSYSSTNPPIPIPTVAASDSEIKVEDEPLLDV